MKPVRSERELPPVFEPVLGRLREEAPQLVGTHGARIVPVSYQKRPFSHVMRLSVLAAEGHPSAFWFAKIQIPKAIPDASTHMSRRVKYEFDTTRTIEAALAGRPGIATVHPIACYPELFAVVTEEVRGVTLLKFLEQRSTWWRGTASLEQAEEVARLTGHWLRDFQTIDASEALVDRTEIRQYIDMRLVRLVSSPEAPITENVRLRLLEHIDALAAAVPSAEWRSVSRHGDLAPGNVIVTRAGIAVLDFAMMSRGSYLHDLTRLSLQIALLAGKPQFRPAALHRIRLALHRGFDPALSEAHSLFRLLTLLHRVNHVATLTLRARRGPGRVYDWWLRQLHLRAIARELELPIEETSPRGERPR